LAMLAMADACHMKLSLASVPGKSEGANLNASHIPRNGVQLSFELRDGLQN